MRTLVVVLAVALCGCAAMHNTPIQDAIWDAYHQCQYQGRIPYNIQLVRVEPDGRCWFQWVTGSYGSTEFQACITENVQATAAARRQTKP